MYHRERYGKFYKGEMKKGENKARRREVCLFWFLCMLSDTIYLLDKNHKLFLASNEKTGVAVIEFT